MLLISTLHPCACSHDLALSKSSLIVSATAGGTSLVPRSGPPTLYTEKERQPYIPLAFAQEALVQVTTCLHGSLV